MSMSGDNKMADSVTVREKVHVLLDLLNNYKSQDVAQLHQVPRTVLKALHGSLIYS